MIQFLFKGLFRDRSRSLFPIIIVVTGVTLTVFGYSWLMGFKSELVHSMAHYDTGHVRIMTNAYKQEASQLPNDLAFIGVDELISSLKNEYPDMKWTPRIKFGGLLDVPDENGFTLEQGPAAGFGLNLLDKDSPEHDFFDIEKSLVHGRPIENPGEIIVSNNFAEKLGINPGQQVTLITSTMYGSMAMHNFIVVGTVHFGIAPMDRGAMIADIRDVQIALDMDDAAGEILGFFGDDVYRDEMALTIASKFNGEQNGDEFSPTMGTLKNSGGMADYVELMDRIQVMLITIFLSIMFIVLWNSGLMGSLRRYGEIGVRLAIGENKSHVYSSMLLESTMIGLIGSAIGTVIGLAFAYYVQENGFDFGSVMKNSTMMMSSVFRAQIVPSSYYIGFIPGLAATLFGTAMSGIGIYKRETSQLFKELEV